MNRGRFDEGALMRSHAVTRSRHLQSCKLTPPTRLAKLYPRPHTLHPLPPAAPASGAPCTLDITTHVETYSSQTALYSLSLYIINLNSLRSPPSWSPQLRPQPAEPSSSPPSPSSPQYSPVP